MIIVCINTVVVITTDFFTFYNFPVARINNLHLLASTDAKFKGLKYRDMTRDDDY